MERRVMRKIYSDAVEWLFHICSHPCPKSIVADGEDGAVVGLAYELGYDLLQHELVQAGIFCSLSYHCGELRAWFPYEGIIDG